MPLCFSLFFLLFSSTSSAPSLCPVGVVVEVVHRLLNLPRDLLGVFSQYVQPRRHTRPTSQLLAHPRPLRLQQQQQQKPCLNTVISQSLQALLESPPPSAENSMREQYSFRRRIPPSLTHTRPASLGLQICPTRFTESPSRRASILPLWSSVSSRFISSTPHGLRTPLSLFASSIVKLTLLVGVQASRASASRP